MSNPTGESKDVFTICKQNVEKFFSEIKKSTPRYQLSVATLQQDYVEAWKNVINSAIALEQEYANKAGLNTNVPEATLKTIRDITEQAIKAYEDQNKIALDATEETTKAFNAFNENTKSFASLNRNIMESMMSAFPQKSKT
jgi:hypothetical protein